MSCSQCFQGTIHDGVLQGKETQLYGRSTYVAGPPEGSEIKGIIVIVSDPLGWTFSNMRMLADTIAKEGSFRVYLSRVHERLVPRHMLTAGDEVLAHNFVRKCSAVGLLGHC